MKHLLTILSGLLVALLFARCADDDNLSGGIDGLPERGIVIRLSTGELDTRTQLTSTGDYHHVEEVWAVLYKWNGNESTDPNDPNNHGNYEFKSATLLKLENGKPWNPYDASTQPRPSKGDDQTDEEYDAALDAYLENMQTNYGGEYGNGKVQGREFVLPETNDMTNGTYRVLCIGLDDKSGEVYDLKKDGNLNLGSTLAEAKAKMTIETKAYEEQTVTYQMYGYDGTGELFAGWTEFEFEPDNINIAEVELKRRVAGILCYVTDIPAKIESTEVKGIRLCLNTKANDEIGLCRLDKPWEDFGAGGGYSSEYAGGTTLAYQDLTGWKQQGGSGEILVKDENGTEVKNLVMGAYLIPINVVDDASNVTNTLSVQLFGGDNYDYENGNLGELIKTFNVLNEQGHSTERGETAERYNILPNYIYHIGDKDDDIDEPMSLLGQKITVKPKIWTDEEIPVEFPSVPIKVTIENSDDFEGEILDCIGIETVLNIRNAVVHKDWYLTTTTSEGVYFKQSDGTYDKFYYPSDDEKESSDIVPVTIVITDYAKYNDYNTTAVEDDKRPIDIQVMVDSEVQDKIEAEQWNAIIVTLEDDEGKEYAVGFSRENKPQMTWGYFDTSPYNIFDDFEGIRSVDDYYGSRNYERALKNADGWDTSAIKAGAENSISIINEKELSVEEGGWFLPAFYELNALFELAWTYKDRGNDASYSALNLREYAGGNDLNRYWSSSVVGSTLYQSWAGYFPANLRSHGNGWKDFFNNDVSGANANNRRERTYYLRSCTMVEM